MSAIRSCRREFFQRVRELFHDVDLYFDIAIPPSAAIAATDVVHDGVEGSKRLQFRWFLLDELLRIDMRPIAMQRHLASGVVPFHLVQLGEDTT